MKRFYQITITELVFNVVFCDKILIKKQLKEGDAKIKTNHSFTTNIM
jgi:hypothetical protein